MIHIDEQDDVTPQKLADAMKFAAKTGRLSNLIHYLNRLDRYAYQDNYQLDERKYPPTKCDLRADSFSPYSFDFALFRLNFDKTKEHPDHEPQYDYWFNGGLIFHGSHDGYGSGAAPTFAVCLTATDGWSLHS